MEVIKRKKRGNKTVEVTVYTKEEADQLGIKYKYWRECTPNDNGKEVYILSDDGYVAPLWKVASYNGRVLVTTGIGRQFITVNSEINFEENKKYNSWSLLKPQSWKVAEARKANVKYAVMTFVKMMLEGHVDWEKLGRIYRKDQANYTATAKRLFKMEEVKKMVDEELKRVLSNLGISKEWLIQKRVNAVQMAENNNDVNNLLKALDKFDEYFETGGKKIRQIEEAEFNWAQLEEGLEDKRTIKLKQKREFLNEGGNGELGA